MENVGDVTGPQLPRSVVVTVVAVWIVLLTATHWGARSPYSYGWAILTNEPENATHLSGAVVNPDSVPAKFVTLYFYTASPLDWPTSQNLKLPLHSFAASMAMAFTRSFLLANYVANVVFAILLALAAVSFADRYDIRRSVALVTLLTVFSLPLFVDYLGQPLQYIVGACASFLVMLAIVIREERNPWALGLAATILVLNYDPYIYLGALVGYVLFAVRFRRVREYAIFVLAAALPNVLWTQYLRLSSRGLMTKHLRKTFIEPVLEGWREMMDAPLENLIQPFVASHIGVHVAMHQIVAIVYWPLIALCVFLLIRLRPRIERGFVLVALLPLFLFLEQIAAAAWDWELNPRRAIPVMLTFAIAWAYSANRVWQQRGWRIAFVALMAMSMFLAMGDTLLKEPVLAYMRTGQAVRYDPHEPIRIENQRLEKTSLPKLMSDEKIEWRDIERARVERWGAFAAGQAIGLLLLVGLFWMCGRAGLFPRWSGLAALGVWVVSLVRFL
jgi:hypothetical protein